jgi:hypothetical protein
MRAADVLLHSHHNDVHNISQDRDYIGQYTMVDIFMG